VKLSKRGTVYVTEALTPVEKAELYQPHTAKVYQREHIGKLERQFLRRILLER